MPENARTSISYFEVTLDFVEPNLKIWLDRVEIVEAVYAALRPWSITVDDLEVIQTGKPSEQGVKFMIPEKRASFFFGAGSCRFTRDGTSWDTAEETIQILDAALKAFQKHSALEIKTFKTAVALHLQLASKKFNELLVPVIGPSLLALDGAPAQTMAAIVKWADHKITIDGSNQIANGIFIRYERDFPGETSYTAMANQLRLDEDRIFATLDIVED